jgi:pantoate--beta-alanine ligase
VAIEVVDTIARFRELLDGTRAAGGSVGFVPTMGYLHQGHVSLMERAAADNDVACASIFVNPLQFAAHEDLSTYPRDLERDVAMAEAAGVRLVLAPPVEEMYPTPIATTVHVDGPSEGMEGASRPHFFDGVATVVTKLFAIAGACRAYFGEKDYQQLLVVRRLANDLSLPVEVVGCPIVREPDGLAMSSRNVYLTPDERAAAPVLLRALEHGASLVEGGERDPALVTAAMAAVVAAEPLAALDYAEAVDAASCRTPEALAGEVRLLVAASFGKARLLDNLGCRAG